MFNCLKHDPYVHTSDFFKTQSCLDTLDITPATVVIGDFNAASPSWGYNYYNHAGRTIEEFLNSQKLELLYNPEDKKTFLHYSGSTTSPDLTMVSSDIYENSQKAVLEDLGSSHRAVLNLFY